MKLNHLNLTVNDVLATHTFLHKYFDLKPLGKGNKNMAFLTDENGIVLSMFRGEGVSERVNEINKRLKDDGFDVPLPSKQHDSWTFYFLAPGGFTIEVLC